MFPVKIVKSLCVNHVQLCMQNLVHISKLNDGVLNDLCYNNFMLYPGAMCTLAKLLQINCCCYEYACCH